jgi:signal transduction histidine kinase
VLQRSRDEFFSIASHELRTPLTAIRGNIDMIKRFYAEKVGDEDFNQMVDDIHSSSIRLIEIVSDFLDASSLEQGKIKFTPEEFNIEEVIEKVAYETNATASEKGVHIGLEKMQGGVPAVYADKNRVKQIVYNLIGNALKFTEKDGSITLHVTADDKLLKVSVEDTGRGISEENQKLLFHKFQQAGDSLYTRDTTRGTGLGLYISKLMSEQMGGSMQLEQSVLDKGSTFSFTLPLASSIPADQRVAATPPSTTTPAPS